MGLQNLSQGASYVRMIAHEIRNPLTAIKIANRLLKDGIREDKDHDMLGIYVDILSNNAERIEQLVKKLLEQNAEELAVPAPIDLCHLIDATISRAGDRIFLQNVIINRSYAPGQLTYGNEGKLMLAFLNIIVNAIESMEHKEGQLWVTVYRAEDRIKVIFKDNGKGMEPEVASRLFEPGFSGRSDGWGFGLAHVKEILDEHGVTLSVTSRPGGGTSVILTFKGM